MTEPESLVLVYLRRIDAKMDVLAEAVSELKLRVSALEIAMALLRRDIAGLIVSSDRSI